MNYPYYSDNFPEEKIDYMYSPFEGVSLLKNYRDHRLSALQSQAGLPVRDGGSSKEFTVSAFKVLEMELGRESEDGKEMFRSLLGPAYLKRLKPGVPLEPPFTGQAAELPRFSIREEVDTLQLVQSLTTALVFDENREHAKKWLDRLVQRFEVTGKLYEGYENGFRKGKGTAGNVLIYWFCTLAICLYYARTREIKYVSTLLKLNDHLCSLSGEMLKDQIPVPGLSVVLAAEVVFVRKLVKKGGIAHAFT